jgi:hypothetical protein
MEYHFAKRNCQDWAKEFLSSVDEDLAHRLPKDIRQTASISIILNFFIIEIPNVYSFSLQFKKGQASRKKTFF